MESHFFSFTYKGSIPLLFPLFFFFFTPFIFLMSQIIFLCYDFITKL